MGTLGNVLDLIECRNAERKAPIRDAYQLTSKCDLHAKRRCGKMAHVNRSSDGIVSFTQVGQNRITSCDLKLVNHLSSSQHSSSLQPQEIYSTVRGHDKTRLSYCSDWNSHF